jgi:tyrosine-protein phosphatase YwqE
MKNKINELSKIVKEKNQEINFLKNCEINYNTININKKEKKIILLIKNQVRIMI